MTALLTASASISIVVGSVGLVYNVLPRAQQL